MGIIVPKEGNDVRQFLVHTSALLGFLHLSHLALPSRLLLQLLIRLTFTKMDHAANRTQTFQVASKVLHTSEVGEVPRMESWLVHQS